MAPTKEYEDNAMRGLSAAFAAAADERAAAPYLAAELLRRPPAARLLFARNSRRYQTAGLCAHLLALIARRRASAPEETLELASLALAIAPLCRAAPPEIVEDLSAEARAERANAERILGRLEEARAGLAAAEASAAKGSGDPLLAAKLHRFRACLLIDLRRLGEAAWQMREARRLYDAVGDRHRSGRAALDLGTPLLRGCEPQAAFEALAAGLAEIDATREPHLAVTSAINLAKAYSDLGEHELALGTLRDLEPLLAVRPTDLLTLRATLSEGKLLAAAGRHAEATVRLRSALQAFQDRGLHRDAALTALELAHSLAQLGRVEELRPLAAPLYLLLRLEEGLGTEAAALVLLVARSLSRARAGRRLAAEVLELRRRLSEALAPAALRR